MGSLGWCLLSESVPGFLRLQLKKTQCAVLSWFFFGQPASSARRWTLFLPTPCQKPNQNQCRLYRFNKVTSMAAVMVVQKAVKETVITRRTTDFLHATQHFNIFFHLIFFFMVFEKINSYSTY